MMRIWAFIVLCAGIFSAAVAPSSAGVSGATERKVALVIGNSDYLHAVTLPNPAKDAKLMALTFQKAGFETMEGVDLDRAEMNAIIDRFTEAAFEADIAVVYYAGHGLQVDGRNYIIPVDAELSSAAHLRTRAIEVDSIMKAMPTDPGAGIIILDACRDNPLARTLAASLPASRSSAMGQGLAQVDTNAVSSGRGGVLIAYATDPGAVALDGKGTNSPYTEALARHIATPGLEIQSALTRVRSDVTGATDGRQRPWHNASLGREIFIGGAAQSQSVPAIAVQSAAATASGSEWEVEQRLWDEASKGDSVAHYQAYLTQFPAGRFNDFAKLKIEKLQSAAGQQVAALSATANSGSQIRTAATAPEDVRQTPGTPSTDTGLRLNQDGKIDLQLRLSALGYEVGSVDGDIGQRTRAAIGAWQQKNGIIETTYLTPMQHAFLVMQTDPLMAQVRSQHEAGKAESARKRLDGETRRAANIPRKRQVASSPRSQRGTVVRRVPSRKGRGGDDLGKFLGGVVVGVGVCKIAGAC